MQQSELIKYKEQIYFYIINTFFKDNIIFQRYVDSKSTLVVLLEISSLAHRYCNTNDNKLKKLLLRQCIVLLFHLETIIRYAEFTNADDLTKVDVSQPTAYSPYNAYSEEIDLIDTLGKFCCNMSMVIWNNFTNKNYSLMTMIEQFKQINNDDDFKKFFLELSLYITSFISSQDEALINEVMKTAFFIKENNLKLNKKISKTIEKVIGENAEIVNKIREHERRQTVGKEQILERITSKRVASQRLEEKSVNISILPEPVVEEQPIIEEPSIVVEEQPDLVYEVVCDDNSITLKESFVNENGEIEESEIKTTIIDNGD